MLSLQTPDPASLCASVRVLEMLHKAGGAQ